MTIIWCMVPYIWSTTDRMFCHFGPIFALWAPSQPAKSKFYKNEKNSMRYYHFTHVHQKSWSQDVRFLRHGTRTNDGQTDRKTDGRKQWHIEVGAPPKNRPHWYYINRPRPWHGQKYIQYKMCSIWWCRYL